MATSAADKLKAETTAAREAIEKKQAAAHAAKTIAENKAKATAASVNKAGASATGALSKTELLSKAMAGLTAKTDAIKATGTKTYQSGGSTFQADKNTNSKIIDLDTYKQGDDAYGNGNNLTPTIPTKSTLGGSASSGLSSIATAPVLGGSVSTGTTPIATAPTLGGSVSTGTTPIANGLTTDQTATDLQSQMVDSAKSAAVTKFQNAYKNAQALAAQQQADLVTDTRTQTGQIRTDDTMARAGTQKIQATQGLAGAGAASQSDMAQNVIKQGATSALTAQSNQLKADINAKLAEAQNARDTGIATAESEAEITKLQYQLDAIEIAEAKATASEAQAKADYLTTISRFQGDYQSEINNVLNDGDTSNDWQVPFLQAARQGKIENDGLDQQGKALPVEEGLISAEAQEALKYYNAGFRTTQVMDILTNAGYQFPVASTGGSGGGVSTDATTTAQDINGYNLFKDLLSQGRVEGREAIEYIATNNNLLVDKYGQYAVDRMTQELTTPETTPEAQVQEPEEVQETKGYTSYIDNYLINPSTTDPYTGEITPATVNIEGVKDYIRNLYQNGTITDVTADQLLSQYGL